MDAIHVLDGLLHHETDLNIEEHYEDILRLAHSIREGTVSASLIMGKLGSYSRQNA